MKKIMLFAAACLALAACSKEIDTTSPEIGDGSAFEKGQKVTLTVRTGDQTKVTSSLDGSTGAVDFKWETGDMIKVTVGQASAQFTLSSGAGEATAEFTGSMPASGDKFNVQYPVTEPDLATQTYSATEALPHDKMKFTATGCTLGNSFTLDPQYAALRLNLYGGAREVSQIDVTCSSSSIYTLSISPAVTVCKDKENATPFFIVLPVTESFASAAVTASAIAATTENTPTYTEGTFSGAGIPISASTTFIATEAKSLSPGRILNMPAVSLTTVWAPVNCGYEPATTSPAYKGYPYGKLYQWGRKYGQGYNDSSYEDADYPGKDGGNQFLVNSSSPQTSHPDGSTYNGNFYYDSSWTIYNWYGGSDPDKLWNSNEGTSNPVSKSAYDPCPEGWRVPTKSELNALITTKIWTNIGGPSGNQTGYLFGTSPNQVFLPAAGCRAYYDGSASDRGGDGSYWSSSVDDSYVWYLYIGSGDALMDFNFRALGYSVRCVQE